MTQRTYTEKLRRQELLVDRIAAMQQELTTAEPGEDRVLVERIQSDQREYNDLRDGLLICDYCRTPSDALYRINEVRVCSYCSHVLGTMATKFYVKGRPGDRDGIYVELRAPLFFPEEAKWGIYDTLGGVYSAEDSTFILTSWTPGGDYFDTLFDVLRAYEKIKDKH